MLKAGLRAFRVGEVVGVRVEKNTLIRRKTKKISLLEHLVYRPSSEMRK